MWFKLWAVKKMLFPPDGQKVSLHFLMIVPELFDCVPKKNQYDVPTQDDLSM